MNYTILHCHTMLSNGVTSIDSTTKYSDYVDKAKECGMTAFAFSEHGSVFEWVHKKNAIEKAGMKYIHAEEFYVTKTLDEKIHDNYHCLLIAKNYDGVLELNKLSSKSFNRENNSYYYVPRISFDDLISASDNIIVSTACLGGILNKTTDSELKERFIEFLCANKHRSFLEIQPHIDDNQIEYNRYLYQLSQGINVPLVMCTDTHALNDRHVKARAIMQKAKGIHFDNEDNFNLTFKTYDELVELCKKQGALPMDVYLDAIEQTNRIADMVEPFELTYEYKYPHLWGENSESVLREKIAQGIINRGVDKYPNYQEYIDRVEYEMQAYKHNQAIDFMLLMTDIIDWCKTQDILVGYGRGSCNGSVVAYLLGITEMDSIKYKLNFERFMNVERVSLSDIDTDFPPNRIDEVKNYIFNKHGLYCSDIVTFNTVALKGAIRDVGRALEIPLSEVSNICDNIEMREDAMRLQYPELFEYVDMVNGCVVSVGNHPCGLICSPHSIIDRLGTFTTSTDTVPISQINMKEVDSLNYVKLDLLKLDTIELINETCKLAGIERLTPDNVDTNDVNVWNSMRDDTTCIFQWEGSTGNDYIKKMLSDESIAKFKEIDENVDRMMLLSIGNSAIRPAGASYREDLAKGVIRKTGSKALDDFLKPTFGYLVFQCQIIEFLHEYCGFTMGQADVVRRHFAKKYGTDKDIPIIKNGGYMDDKQENYIKGFIQTMKEKYDMSKEEAEKTIVYFLQVIEDASNYLFSLNHSQPYSFEGYVAGWLRYYYPLEFLTVALNINMDKEEKTDALTSYAKNRGIKIHSPQFRKSKSNYAYDKELNTIYKGLASIKHLNSQCGDFFWSVRDKEYDGFFELLNDMKQAKIDSRQLDILIRLDFFKEFGNPNQLLEYVEIFNTYYGKKIIRKDSINPQHLPYIIQFSRTSTDKQFRDIDTLGLIKAICSTINTTTSQEELAAYQSQLLGMCDVRVVGSPYCVVTSVEINNYGTPYVGLYCLHSGNTMVFKADKKFFADNSLDVGDIVKIALRDKPKRKKIDDKWVQDGTERTLVAWSLK